MLGERRRRGASGDGKEGAGEGDSAGGADGEAGVPGARQEV
jgi:hypothetical protein